MDIVRYLFGLLTQRERRNLYLLFGAVLIMAGLEVGSVASIMPFLSVAADPGSIQETSYLQWAFDFFGFYDEHSFLVALGVLVLCALILSNAFIIFVTWLQYKYVWNRNHSISKRLLRRYLNRPYEYFLTRNTADLSKNILEEAREVSYDMLLPAIQGVAKGIVALAILAFLLVVNPLVAFIVAATIGGAYAIIYGIVRRKLDILGRKRVEANEDRYKSVSEAFGGIKEVKLRGKEEIFVEQFSRPSKRYANYHTQNRVISASPRYILEAVAFGGVILAAIYLIAEQDTIGNVIPMLGLYAFAGYRLMPALQRAFQGLAKARFNKEALRTLHRDLDRDWGESTRAGVSESDDSSVDTTEMELERCIKVDSVRYTYPGADEPAIDDVSMKVEAETIVGIVGRTGSGKTTVVDVILGLLRPESGAILVDGRRLKGGNMRAWQERIGYVPQNIYLADESIARNVAFGVPAEEIDYQGVVDALESAQLRDFVLGRLPEQLETVVGERGVKLSGGQRQRIGIARALYHDPDVIVFDEATSALDQKTEQSLMEAIYALGGGRTILLVSHRMSTVRRAETIFVFDSGNIVSSGGYQELVESSSVFRNMTTGE